MRISLILSVLFLKSLFSATSDPSALTLAKVDSYNNLYERAIVVIDAYLHSTGNDYCTVGSSPVTFTEEICDQDFDNKGPEVLTCCNYSLSLVCAYESELQANTLSFDTSATVRVPESCYDVSFE